MTKEQVLQAEGDALSRMAGEVFEIEHDWFKSIQGGMMHCSVCRDRKITDDYKGRTIEFPDNRFCSIPLTPANAFKWRDWAVEKYGQEAYNSAMLDTMLACNTIDCTVLNWSFCHAEPKHYIKASMLCKEQSNE